MFERLYAISTAFHDVSAVLDEMDACTAESLGRPVRTCPQARYAGAIGAA